MKALREILGKILASNPSFQDRKKEFEVYECWEKAVGSRVAKNCWPVKLLPGGVLLVASGSSSWLNQMRYLEAQVLERLEEELKDRRVKQLRYKLQLTP